MRIRILGLMFLALAFHELDVQFIPLLVRRFGAFDPFNLAAAPDGVDRGNDFWVLGNLTGKGDTLSIRGSTVTGSEAGLTINARVQMPPETLDTIVRETLAAVCKERIAATTMAWRCLSPGRPNPTHRYDHIVEATGA